MSQFREHHFHCCLYKEIVSHFQFLNGLIPLFAIIFIIIVIINIDQLPDPYQNLVFCQWWQTKLPFLFVLYKAQSLELLSTFWSPCWSPEQIQVPLCHNAQYEQLSVQSQNTLLSCICHSVGMVPFPVRAMSLALHLSLPFGFIRWHWWCCFQCVCRRGPRIRPSTSTTTSSTSATMATSSAMYLLPWLLLSGIGLCCSLWEGHLRTV